jgi:prepilin-type N-terminal cleavage/methylation domain-containing protein/prepilin-type processing-associated H-X9-DG protein
MHRKAFTLIELLVVIAIIALLLSVVMPALKKAKNHAQAIICLSALKQMSMAWTFYADDNDDVLVYGHVSSTGWVQPPIATNSGDPIEDEKEGIRQGKLYPYLESEDIYHCPADRGMGMMLGIGFRTFSITGPMHGEGWSGDDEFYIEKKSEVIAPCDKFVFIENTDDRNFNLGSWVMNIDPDGWVDPLAVWHDKKSTFGFADGHAQAHKWVDESTLDMIDFDRPDPLTFYQPVYPSDSGDDLEWAAMHYTPK